MMQITSWGEVVLTSLQKLWSDFLLYSPSLVAAIIVLVVGWVLAVILGKIVSHLTSALWIDKGLEKLGIHESLQKVGISFNVAGLLGWIVKWFLIIAFLIASADILGLQQITEFLNKVVLFIPNVIIAVVVLVFGLVIGNFLSNVVRTGVEATQFRREAGFVSGVAKWSVVVFSFMAALVQLGVAASLIQILFTGFVAMVALAGGLAFGLGGRDVADKILERLREDLGGE